MAIESWLPALLGYLMPVGLFLLSWGGMSPERARRATTVAALAAALAAIGYFAVGFAFHLGGAQVINDHPAFAGLDALWAEAEHWGLIGLAGFFLAQGADGGPLSPEAMALFVIYLPLVATAVLLVALSLHEWARGWHMVAGGVIMATVLFPLAACWAWGGGWLSNLGVIFEQGGHGFVDHAGSAVVYLLGGMAALGALVGLGLRLSPGEPEEPAEMPPVHFPLLANLGALLFGVGWLGWSLSMPFHASGATLNLPRIAVNGLLAAGGGILASQIYCWITVGYADALMSARGAVVGMIAVSAGAPFMPAWAALIVGVVAGVCLPLCVYVVDRVLRLPDGAAAIPLGVTGGLWGALAAGLFADGRWGQGWNRVVWGVNDLRAGQGVLRGGGQLVSQLAGVGAIALFAFLVNWLLFLGMNLLYRPRRERRVETEETGAVEETTGGTAMTQLSGRLAALWRMIFPARKAAAEPDDSTKTPES